MRTIHATARNLLSYERGAKISAKCPDWIEQRIRVTTRRAALRRAAREAIRVWESSSTAHLYRDYRPGIGSGRTAHWLDSSYARYAIIARTLHDTLGWSGERVRAAARRLIKHGNGLSQSTPVEPLPDDVLSEERAEARANGAVKIPRHAGTWSPAWAASFSAGTEDDGWRILDWWLWYETYAVPRIAEAEALGELARLRSDPGARISGYLADSIASWRAAKRGYEGCSGSERYHYYRDRPELWPELLAHAPAGAVMRDAFGEITAEQVYPHERERAKRLRDKGWYETMRLSDSIFSLRHPVAP